MKKILILLAALSLVAPAPLAAQQAPVAKVLSSCGSATYSAGSSQAITQDTTGAQCTSAGGGGGGNVNLTGINGVTPLVGAGATGTGSLRTTQAQDTTTLAGSAPGTAGTPSANVLTIQGATSMTPVANNQTQVNGTTLLANTGATGAGSPRVTAAQDTSTVAGAAPLTTGIYVTGPSAAALATAANQARVQAVNGATAATSSMMIGYADGSGNTAQVTSAAGLPVIPALPPGASTATAQATTNSTLATIDTDIKAPGNIQGVAASGATDSDIPLSNGGRAATAAPTAVTDGQKVAQQFTPEGIAVIRPYAIKELMVRGTITFTDTGAHTIIASAGGSLKNYITSLQCGRTDAGATAIVLTLSDAASTVIILPSGGATNIVFPIPLATAAATAFTVTSGTSISTGYCSAQGYTGL